MEKTQKFYCQIGDHYWERPSSRGKPPHNCPEHRPTAPVVTKRRPVEYDEEGNPSRHLTDDHIRRMQEGRKRKLEEKTLETTEQLRVRLEQTKVIRERAEVAHAAAREAQIAAGGARKCSDKIFDAEITAFHRIMGILYTERSIEAQLAAL